MGNLLAPLLASYKPVHRETDFFGPWKEAYIRGFRVGFQEILGDQALVHIGNFDPNDEQVTDLYLGQVGQNRPLPAEGSLQRLERFVSAAGRPLASRFFLLATGPDEYPVLRIAAFAEALLRLSPNVRDVGVYESGGVHLALALKSIPPDRFVQDVDTGIDLAIAANGK